MEQRGNNRITDLPEAFLSRMKTILGERYREFVSAMEAPP